MYKLKITKEVLKKSKFCNMSNAPINCAVSFAIRDIFPSAFVYVYSTDIWAETINHPPQMTEFIKRFDYTDFDKRESMPEESFEIEVPDSIIEKIGITEVKKIIENSQTLEFA